MQGLKSILPVLSPWQQQRPNILTTTKKYEDAFIIAGSATGRKHGKDSSVIKLVSAIRWLYLDSNVSRLLV